MPAEKSAALKALTPPRIVLWRGGSVWLGTAEGATGFHDHHALQISLSPGATPMRFRAPGEDWTDYAAVLVAAHQPHAFAAPGALVAFVFVEPETQEGRAIRARHNAGLTPLPAALWQDCMAELAAAYRGNAADAALIAPARALIARLAAQEAGPPRPLDARIARAIDYLHITLDRPVTLADAAARAHLSPERFRHLFQEETGIRFRAYLLWLRLEVALAGITAGHSLTAAASAAGFADSAHFARTFRRMFGIAATSLRPQETAAP